MFYENNKELGFDDVTISPHYSNIKSRKDVSIYTDYGNMSSCTPYFVTNMSSVGNIKAAKFLFKYSIPVAIHKYVDTYDLERHIDSEYGKLSIISIGLDEDSQKHLRLVKKLPYLLIDVPNGYIQDFYTLCDRVRNDYPDAWIMAGNVIGLGATSQLANIGVNCVRLGIGGGSVCRTSNKTGVGRKPISTILECVRAKKECGWTNLKLCWDGGIRNSSDICKALHAGADYVSCGRLFAPFTEINQNEPIGVNYRSIEDVSRYHLCNFPPFPQRLPFYGMSSEHANDKYAGGLKDYRAAEGVTEYLEIKQNPEAFINDINGSIRSFMTYTGRRHL